MTERVRSRVQSGEMGFLRKVRGLSLLEKVVVVVVIVEGYPLQVRHKQDRAENLFFYYPRLLHCLNQMLAVVLFSQHRVSSSKTVRPRAPCGARCIGHAVRTWSAVCSETPHSQFDEGARPHLCMVKSTDIRQSLYIKPRLLQTERSQLRSYAM